MRATKIAVIGPAHAQNRIRVTIVNLILKYKPRKKTRFCEWRSEEPSARNSGRIAQNLRSDKIQGIGNKRIGSLGKIRTSNPSVNSRMLYH
jgi:hypothetical protein